MDFDSGATSRQDKWGSNSFPRITRLEAQALKGGLKYNAIPFPLLVNSLAKQHSVQQHISDTTLSLRHHFVQLLPRQWTFVQIDFFFVSEGSQMEGYYAQSQPGSILSWPLARPSRRQVTIDLLSSVALLEIFGFYLSVYGNSWHTLIHVCRRWRNVVFRWPHRLNVEIPCSFGRRPVREALDIWPHLPINISGDGFQNRTGDVDNVVVALKHKDRVCKIDIRNVSRSKMEEMLAAMQEPFPALIVLKLRPEYAFKEPPVVRVTDSFLGISAPRLQILSLNPITIPFPVLQELLLSATGLNSLLLKNIPDLVYFSPDAIVTCLSALTRLKELEITFQSPRSRPVRESRHPPPLIRIILPALTKLTFQGVSEYLEDLVAQIDAPRLQALFITFFHQLFFHTPQLSQFISRTPRLQGHDEARVAFTHYGARVTFRLPSSPDTKVQDIRVGVECKHPDLQLLSLVQVCASFFPQAFIPTVKHLYILENREYDEYDWECDLGDWKNNVQNSQWLELLRPFIAVKDLYISEKIVAFIAPALQELVGERVTETLPALECVFLDGLRASGPVMDCMRPFVAARQLSTHPIVVSYWDGEDDDWWEDDWKNWWMDNY